MAQCPPSVRQWLLQFLHMNRSAHSPAENVSITIFRHFQSATYTLRNQNRTSQVYVDAPQLKWQQHKNKFPKCGT